MDSTPTAPKIARVKRHKTALARTTFSRPIRLALDAGVLRQDRTVLDYGCGRGADVRLLRKQGFDCEGWDPSHRANGVRRPSEIVNLGYVVNVIESPEERSQALLDAWSFATRTLVVSAQMIFDARPDRGTPHNDGLLSSKGTFQKYYSQTELRAWIEQTLGTPSAPAAPGVFFVFRDPGERQSFLAARYRRRAAMPKKRRSDVLFEQHAALLEPLMSFFAARGRLPEDFELTEAPAISEALGTIRQAFRVVLRVTGEDQWAAVRAERTQDLLLYLALERFGGRPRFSELPADLQLDVREFFGNYSHACEEADKLLFAVGDMDVVDETCRGSPVGKETPEALYVHVSALDSLPHLLRVYEGCARACVGVIDGANVVKLNRWRPRISYLCYPDFEKTAHPALLGSLRVDLQRFQADYRDYSASENPPILHRKEQLVGADHPLREKWLKLTAQEETYGVYADTKTIGNRRGWETALALAGIAVRGHRVVRQKSPPQDATLTAVPTPIDPISPPDEDE